MTEFQQAKQAELSTDRDESRLPVQEVTKADQKDGLAAVTAPDRRRGSATGGAYGRRRGDAGSAAADRRPQEHPMEVEARDRK